MSRLSQIENALHDEIQINTVYLNKEVESTTKEAQDIRVNKEKDISNLRDQVRNIKDRIDSIASDMVKALERQYEPAHVIMKLTT